LTYWPIYLSSPGIPLSTVPFYKHIPDFLAVPSTTNCCTYNSYSSGENVLLIFPHYFSNS